MQPRDEFPKHESCGFPWQWHCGWPRHADPHESPAGGSARIFLDRCHLILLPESSIVTPLWLERGNFTRTDQVRPSSDFFYSHLGVRRRVRGRHVADSGGDNREQVGINPTHSRPSHVGGMDQDTKIAEVPRETVTMEVRRCRRKRAWKS